MEELTRLVDLVHLEPGITSGQLRDRLRREGRSSITTSDVEHTLGSAVSLVRSEHGPAGRWWPAASADRPGPGVSRPTSESTLPPLHRWQREALAAWRTAGYRGVIEAVTGTGKTVVGLAAAEEELARRGQVAVIVPTRELMVQWSRLMAPVLPAGATMGLLGDGARDGVHSHDVVVAVVNSARHADLRPRRPGGLLIADECHRYASEHNRAVLHHGFPRRLGLSATFARPDDAHRAWLQPYFGAVQYRYGYQAARRDGVIAPFDVILLMVDLAPDERSAYEERTRLMAAAFAQLAARGLFRGQAPSASLAAIVALAQADDDNAAVARAYLGAMQERRRGLDGASAKLVALTEIATVLPADARALVFSQSIDAAEEAVAALQAGRRRAAALHSGLAPRDRRMLLDRFRDGDLDTLAAPQVLDEGIDVPEAEVAVVLGSSRSRRQMVQRMGRVLRRKADGRPARFVAVLARDTIEDPAHGAHEAFLDEILPVARHVTTIALGAPDLAPMFRR